MNAWSLLKSLNNFKDEVIKCLFQKIDQSNSNQQYVYQIASLFNEWVKYDLYFELLDADACLLTTMVRCSIHEDNYRFPPIFAELLCEYLGQSW